MKVLVFIEPDPIGGVTKLKGKKRWDSTVDHFYFHHWFRTHNLLNQIHVQIKLSLIAQEQTGMRKLKLPWVRQGRFRFI